MKKLFILFVAALVVITSGCNGNIVSKNTNNASSGGNDVSIDKNTKETHLKKYTKDNIYDNYKVKKENEPLKKIVLNDESYKKLLNDCKIYSRMSSDCFRIEYVKERYGIGELREINFENDKMFYCIFSNEKDNKRQYLFFDYLEEDLFDWRCCENLSINNKANVHYSDSTYYKYIKAVDKF